MAGRAWIAPMLAAALCAASACLPAQAANEAVRVGPVGCRFAVPAGWSPRDIRWTGACSGGAADGRGVLREFAAGKVQRIYFGLVVAGQLSLGVIELPDGFIAGRFEAGRAVRDGDRNTLIRAFDEGRAAAEQVAATYERAGNAASARFYRDKADQLARQMD